MTQDFGVNQALVEDQYRRFLENPLAVDPEWRKFFDKISDEQAEELAAESGQTTHGVAPNRASVSGARRQAASVAPTSRSDTAWRMSRMVTAYRSRGHYYARIDPLGLSNVESDELSTAAFGIADDVLDQAVPTDIKGMQNATPRQVLTHMRATYCSTVGYELMQIEDPSEREWLLDRVETPAVPAAGERRKWMLERLTDAEAFEQFLHTQYIGAKRFSLEGLETVIPVLQGLIERAAEQGVTDVVIGMAHRGRLNVLANILHKSLKDMFSAFNDKDEASLVGRGDVKYHLGNSTTHVTSTGKEINVSLCFNPSHLEFVNPVVVGRCRARQDRKGDTEGRTVLPIMIHGDSAFIGQGVVPETMNLAQLEGYSTGGTVHIILNNQVGFTTGPSDARSSRYASDMIRFLRAPVFHLNAEDVDAALRITELSADYRQTFLQDVCIDLVGYRRHGHNESDEPRFTQPQMYAVIDKRESVRTLFRDHLVASGVLDEAEAQEMSDSRRAMMKEELERAKAEPTNRMPELSDSVWQGFKGGAEADSPDVDTSVPLERLTDILTRITTVPDNVTVHPKILKAYKNRGAAAVDHDKTFDWGTGEALAFATLLADGFSVRVSGQDSRRGTFSHRHAELVDMNTGGRWSPFDALVGEENRFSIYDSPLSEAAVLGFEYGYTLEEPNSLVVWEAQFGDFANGAQVIIDQFIASGEDKWNRLSGVTMLLPHGFEGQGPEHSYARLGRFLQMCAEDCWQVCDCTTPAQFFHLLRRQMVKPWRKPLIVMTPKSLLRHKRAVSTLHDLAHGQFMPIIPDTSGGDPASAKRLLICSGRIYYDLEQEREKRKADNVHIVRIEQLYPLRGPELARILAPYAAGTELFWVQDEPWNMGAWYFINTRLRALFGDGLPLKCVARAESASPATGSAAAHRFENKTLMNAAFT